MSQSEPRPTLCFWHGRQTGCECHILTERAGRATSSEELAAESVQDDGLPTLDRELAAIYLAAAMKECGYTADERDAAAILDYIQADNNAVLALRGAAPPLHDPTPQEARDEWAALR